MMKTVSRGTLVGLLLSLCVVSPALADPAAPTDYRSQITSIEPATDRISMSVVGGDSFIELVAQPGTDVVVKGYSGEPYLWFRGDGSVLENANSPTKYLNARRFGGSDVPAGLDATSTPAWRKVGVDHRWVWHDHRSHWMQKSRPLGAHPGDQILESVIPLRVDGRDVKATVISTWLPAPSTLPVWLGLFTGIAVIAVSWWSRRRSGARWSAVWVLPVTVLALLVGGVQFLSLPVESGPRLVWWALPAIAVICAVAGVVAGVTRRLFWADAATLIVGVELALWGWLKRGGLADALIPTSAPGWLDRYTVVLAMVAGGGATVLALGSLFVISATAATGSPSVARP
jgi:hypothetical protein